MPRNVLCPVRPGVLGGCCECVEHCAWMIDGKCAIVVIAEVVNKPGGITEAVFDEHVGKVIAEGLKGGPDDVHICGSCCYWPQNQKPEDRAISGACGAGFLLPTRLPCREWRPLEPGTPSWPPATCLHCDDYTPALAKPGELTDRHCAVVVIPGDGIETASFSWCADCKHGPGDKGVPPCSVCEKQTPTHWQSPETAPKQDRSCTTCVDKGTCAVVVHARKVDHCPEWRQGREQAHDCTTCASMGRGDRKGDCLRDSEDARKCRHGHKDFWQPRQD